MGYANAIALCCRLRYSPTLPIQRPHPAHGIDGRRSNFFGYLAMDRLYAFFLFASLLMVPSLPAQCASFEDGGASPYARTLLEQINNYRNANSLPSLRFDDRLNHLAMTHSFAMSRQKRMSHANFDERFQRSGSRMCVENVGWNSATPLKQFDAWQHSPGHDENMLKEGIRYVGIAEVGKYVTFFACQ